MHQRLPRTAWVSPFFCGTLAPIARISGFPRQRKDSSFGSLIFMALGFGFSKVKVLAQAEKFVQQGKLPNAITEYEKIIKEDPKDLTVLNTVGDLYAKTGNHEQATYYFKRVGDQYAQNGFTVKAIAIYKKLTKIGAYNLENMTKLAELYSQQGLFNDARVHYMQAADHLLKSGDNTHAAKVFQRILELDPE